MNYFDTNDYINAIKHFNDLEKQYPLSNEAIQAKVMIAFIDYVTLNYDDAILKFNIIINKYPALKNIDYVYYMKAMCYYEQLNNEGLDGENNIKSIENFQQVIKRFPKSKYARDSEQKIILVKSNVAAKHMNIARFYQKKDKFGAALNRYKIIVEEYSMTKFIPEALFRIVEIYYNIGLYEDAKKTASILGYNYPDSKWYKYSYNLLQDNKNNSGYYNKIKNLF